ncbi:zinc finger BED domain-containing protein RICESLEEPER 2-like isoform X2 [Spinacia oleracea]|uniref:Zinc finger BED domain-containing protein RICESLEEPER 2-like isoform X2 n=1 Tax=Spinacia oleracea TaxID=3562 RepID=A0ABM3R468_SPIOL|nr:zinc finger BED domain-containing protein RICESLEEPER 2-like isoform X2 [Spinacia oleracea]
MIQVIKAMRVQMKMQKIWRRTRIRMMVVIMEKDQGGKYLRSKMLSLSTKRVIHLTKIILSSDDWEMVQKVCSFLEIFYEVTHIISGSDYPTSNLFLPELTMIKESLDEKSKSDDVDMRRMALIMKTKFDKYWGDLNLLISVAAVMDPRNKLKLVEFFFRSLYDNFEASEHIYIVKTALHDIYKEYMEAFSNENFVRGYQVDGEKDADDPYNSNVGAKGTTKGRKKFDNFIRNVDVVESLKTELDIYLEEGVYICNETETEHFDPLNWWRANNLKYRILSRMACDILAIPITSVASEATFSAGGRVIEPHRANIGAETVQMLLCGEDWLRSFYGIKRKKAKIDGVTEVNLV